MQTSNFICLFRTPVYFSLLLEQEWTSEVLLPLVPLTILLPASWVGIRLSILYWTVQRESTPVAESVNICSPCIGPPLCILLCGTMEWRPGLQWRCKIHQCDGWYGRATHGSHWRERRPEQWKGDNFGTASRTSLRPESPEHCRWLWQLSVKTSRSTGVELSPNGGPKMCHFAAHELHRQLSKVHS